MSSARWVKPLTYFYRCPVIQNIAATFHGSILSSPKPKTFFVSQPILIKIIIIIIIITTKISAYQTFFSVFDRFVIWWALRLCYFLVQTQHHFYFDQVRVGAVSFSKTVTPQFGLGEYEGKDDMLKRIEQISYEGLGTNTGEALNYLYTKVGFQAHGTNVDFVELKG